MLQETMPCFSVNTLVNSLWTLHRLGMRLIDNELRNNFNNVLGNPSLVWRATTKPGREALDQMSR